MATWCAATASVPKRAISSAPIRNSQASAVMISAIGAPRRSTSAAASPGCQPPRPYSSSSRSRGCQRYMSANTSTITAPAVAVATPQPRGPSAGRPQAPLARP
ncbi:hypothetical protein D3C83_52470 [compost metagenome]